MNLNFNNFSALVSALRQAIPNFYSYYMQTPFLSLSTDFLWKSHYQSRLLCIKPFIILPSGKLEVPLSINRPGALMKQGNKFCLWYIVFVPLCFLAVASFTNCSIFERSSQESSNIDRYFVLLLGRFSTNSKSTPWIKLRFVLCICP